jgi:acyl carrier protein
MISQKVKSIIISILNDKNLDLLDETPFTSLPSWDSFMYIDFILSCETEFRIKFQPEEIENLKNLNDFIKSISIKINY